ncbi:MAG: hypothetical protein AB4038_12310 [Prochloraceae cyanobacterium]
MNIIKLHRKIFIFLTSIIVVGQANSLQVSACPLSGEISGTEGRSFCIILVEPNTRQVLMNTETTGTYDFSQIPTGHYLLRVFRYVAGNIYPVSTEPYERAVNCRGGQPIKNINFEVPESSPSPYNPKQ